MNRADYRIIADAFFSCRPTRDHFRYKAWESTMTSVGEALVKADARLSLEWWMDCCFFGRVENNKHDARDPFKTGT